jgi:23S rRNA (adenine2503-C2)-methyltransferase
MKDIKNYTLEELAEALKDKGFPKFSGQQIFNWLYKKKVEAFTQMSDISRECREFLKKNFYVSGLKLLKKEVSCDGTEKFLFGLDDKNTIESVLIPKKNRNTLCISTQVGCKFKCAFCASGRDGLIRNLLASEVVGQYLGVSKLITPRKITNIVFMGIGEPLDNFSNILKTIEILIESKGIYFTKKRICISTCGLIPQINKLSDLNLGVMLSVSLHAANDETRSRLMPINKKYPLKDLMKAARDFSRGRRHAVTFEYALIEGLNSSLRDAAELGKLLRGMPFKVNLIPLNCSFAGFSPPKPEEANAFKDELIRRHIFCTLRQPRGQDIDAACGQLRAKHKHKND